MVSEQSPPRNERAHQGAIWEERSVGRGNSKYKGWGPCLETSQEQTVGGRERRVAGGEVAEAMGGQGEEDLRDLRRNRLGLLCYGSHGRI